MFARSRIRKHAGQQRIRAVQVDVGSRCADKFGRGGEIRTPDPHNPIVVRYQAALRPDRNRQLCLRLRQKDRVVEKGPGHRAQESGIEAPLGPVYASILGPVP